MEEKGWVRLEDDKGIFAADNIVPVINTELSETYGEDFVRKVDSISTMLTTEDLLDLVRQVDIDKADPDEVAKTWCEDHDLV